jgi:Na+/phosphate symporter
MQQVLSVLLSSHLREFLAGISFFLYALDRIEDITKNNASQLQYWIQRFTNTRIKSIFAGV